MIKFKRIRYLDLLVYFFILVFVIVFILLSFGRHDLLKSYLNDLGTYDQVVWNTLHGDFFDNSANMLGARNYLGAHFSPILLLFVPFYFVWSNPKWLLFFQVLAVGLSAIPIYLFAKEKLKSCFAALVFLVSYLFYPVLHNGLLYDFHEVVLAVFFASFSFYFLEKGKDKWFVLFSVLLVLSQEHLSLLVFMMGLYLVFLKKRKKFGLAVSVSSMAFFVLVMAILIPFFSSAGDPALLSNDSEYGSRYAWLGSSFSEIVKNIVLHPVAIFKAVLSFERARYLFLLILPVFSLAIYSWPVVIIIPILLINLLSNNLMTFNVYFYHSAIVAPFIYFASILTFKRWFSDDALLRKIFLILIFISTLLASVLYGLTPLSTKYALSDFMPTSQHAKAIIEVKKIIPRDASLSVQHNLGPHLSERKEVYRFPLKKDEVEYILVDQVDPYRNNKKQIFQFGYALQMNLKEWREKIDELKKSPDFEIVYENDGYILFKNNKPEL